MVSLMINSLQPTGSYSKTRKTNKTNKTYFFMELQKFRYDNQLPKLFAVATIGWGAIGMLVGVLIAFQLAFPILNFGIEYTSFGRLRPVHTNAVIFAFVGNGIFTAVYYSMPRLLKTPMWSKTLGNIHFLSLIHI